MLKQAFNVHVAAGDVYKSNVTITAVTKFINTQLPELMRIISDEAEFAIGKEIGSLPSESSVARFGKQ